MIDEYTQKQKALVQQLEDNFARGVSASTLVDVQPDYARDPQICLTALSFVPEELSSILNQEIIEPLRHIEPEHYFYPSESLHWTIKNVRTIHEPRLFTPEDVKKVDELFAHIIPTIPAFEFHMEDVILFPTSISVVSYSNQIYQKLVLALDKGLKDIGVPDNKTYISNEIFCGNTTVCRFVKKPVPEFVAAVRKLRHKKIGSFKVQTVKLITCNAVCHPDSRTVINEYRLR